ncbi:hypothetical protein EJ04DRAFT_433054 [Polyplosphaeria fusca]|uniref:Uncharacterized protein n=1 Tax=Polyplosphaeria fusca TaxID=682080 RepID=A0A9P4R4B1_9PLEO|nr:hypothetical protein EJ04DRAFT_433054 [Polyplosphaeria fusca]
MSSQKNNRILNLPAEIRNNIYRCTLSLGVKRRIPRNGDDMKPRDYGFRLLQLCRQINVEARSLLEQSVTAYIPILGGMSFDGLISNINLQGPSSLYPVQNTLLTALLTFHQVHIHLHTQWFLCACPQKHERVHPSTEYIYGRLRQALLIYTSASQKVSHASGTLRRRKATIHLDHLLCRWFGMIDIRGPYAFSDILKIMARDTFTDWSLRFYVAANDMLTWTVLDKMACDGVAEVRKLIRQYEAVNVTVTVEVYGDKGIWSMEVKERGGDWLTRDVTPSSKLWPSWPDDVKWRQG